MVNGGKMIYLKYLWYVIKHKWFVLVECFKMGLYWQGLIHDLSKFLPDEFFPYAQWFYGKYGYKYGNEQDENNKHKRCENGFDLSWLYHIHRNPHHWQYWILIQDEDEDKILSMSDKYIKEMICDWIGAGRAQGTPNTHKWYEKHKNKMQLHPKVRKKVDDLL